VIAEPINIRDLGNGHDLMAQKLQALVLDLFAQFFLAIEMHFAEGVLYLLAGDCLSRLWCSSSRLCDLS
jgi:hypothetical protein